jgi:hypothetical protein
VGFPEEALRGKCLSMTSEPNGPREGKTEKDPECGEPDAAAPEERDGAPQREDEAETDPLLEQSQTLFSKGDYKESARLAREIVDSDRPEDVREKARDLLFQMEPDTVAIWIGICCLVLIALLAVFTLG